MQLLRPFLTTTPKKGALTQLYCATSKEVEKNDYRYCFRASVKDCSTENVFRGRYFVPDAKLGKKSKLAEDEQLGKDLWSLAEQLVKEKTGTL